MPESSLEPGQNLSPETRPLLDLAIRKKLGNFELEADLRLSTNQGQVLVLFGPSGSGKTITLRCIAGALDPDAGYISIDGRVVFDSRHRVNVKLADRRVGYLPQNYALFPHLTIADNIAFGLFNREKKQAARRVRELVSLMQLDDLENRYPRQLSGGQQQRVAFARALAPEPSILLLDEPFSALDAAIRAELRQNLALLSRELALPVVFITHDLEEAYMLADRIAVYERGRILQYGSRDDVFYRPATREVARLVNMRNIWPGTVVGHRQHENTRLVQFRVGFGDLWAAVPATFSPDGSFTLSLRPEQANLAPYSEQYGSRTENRFRGYVVGEISRGSLSTLFFQVRREPGAPASYTGQPRPGFNQPYDIELEVTARHYQDLQRAGWQDLVVEIDPAALHLLNR